MSYSFFDKLSLFYSQTVLKLHAEKEKDLDLFKKAETSEDIYHKLNEAAAGTANHDLSYELRILSELYNKAIELNAGWNYVYRAVSNFINVNLNEDEGGTEENEYIESLLNDAVKELKKKAGGKFEPSQDTANAINEFKQIKNVINQEAIEDEMGSSEYEEGEGGLTQYDERAKSVLNPFEGADSETQKGRGFSFVNKHYSDPVQKILDENERYKSDLDFEKGKNPKVEKNIERIIQVNIDLAKLRKKEIELNDHAELLEPEAKEELQPQFNQIINDISKLRKDKTAIKMWLRKYYLERNNIALQKKIEGNLPEKEKRILEIQKNLNDIRLSKDQYKTEEFTLMKRLLLMLQSGTPYDSDIVRSLIAKIQEANAKRKPAEVRAVEIADKIREKKQSGNLEGLIITLTHSLATQKIVVKQLITDQLEKEKHHILLPFLEAINKAKEAGNEMEIKNSIKKLREKMNIYAEEQPLLKDFVVKQKLFSNWKDSIKVLQKSDLLNQSVIDDQTKALIHNIIERGKELTVVEYRAGKQNKDTLGKIKENMQPIIGILQGYL